tara:strand:+ start:1153 stop:2490 length:1338 start_codon:yes stop_codon:yes gene_type:complete
MESGIQMPYSVEDERGVLSCMLQDSGCIVDAASVVTPDHFYELVHRALFEEIVKRGTNDLILLAPDLSKRDKSLVHTAAIIQDEVASISHMSLYIERLQTLKQLRDIKIACTEAMQSMSSDARPDDLMDELESSLVSVSKSSNGKKSLKDHVVAAIDQIELWQLNDSTVNGVPTGLPDLDSLTMGLQPGEMTILAARPSVGKTAMSLQVMNHACITKKVPTVFFSLEMSAASLIHRVLSLRCSIDSFAMRRRLTLTDANIIRMTNEASNIKAAPLEIFDDVYQLSEIRSKARAVAKRHGLGLIVVDYLQLVRTRQSRDREQEVSSISSSLKALAKELSVPVLALCQLNRGVESREGARPRMSDLRESGSLEQDADVVSLLNRPYPDEDIIELIVAKQRNGPTGTVVLEYNRKFNEFKPVHPDIMDDGHEKTVDRKTSQKDLITCQ